MEVSQGVQAISLSLEQPAQYCSLFSSQSTTFIKSYAAVTDIHFSPSTPHRYVVTSGTRLQVYTPKTQRVVKTISRFKDTVRSGHLRDDGKLIIAGDDSGLVQIFDLASRAILRTIKDHSQSAAALFLCSIITSADPVEHRPVHTTLFSGHNGNQVPQILTSSDDGSVRTFDLSTAEPLSNFQTHTDYVRTAAFVPSSPNLYLSGSYDTTVKLWDARMQEGSGEAMSLNHGYPVESLLVHPSGTTAISAGGPVIKIWDLLTGNAKPLKVLSNHQKTVTALCWGDQNQSRILSAGLDGLVKSYSVFDGDWRVGHTMRFGGQLLSLALSPKENMLCVGAADGTLSIKSQPPTLVETQQSKKAKAARDPAPRPPKMPEPEKSVEVTWRSKTGPTHLRQPRLAEWDRLMKVFRYADALDAALDQPDPRITIAVFDELKHLDGLNQALGARNDRDLVRILKFLRLNVNDPRWGSRVAEYVDVVLGKTFSLSPQDLFHWTMLTLCPFIFYRLVRAHVGAFTRSGQELYADAKAR